MCTEIEQLDVSHVTWIGQSSLRQYQELAMEARKADAQLAWKLSLDVLKNFIICLDMWHDHPGKFVLTLLNVLTLLPKLFAVTCDSRHRSGSVHISLVSMNQTTGYYLSLKQYTRIIFKFGSFSCSEIYFMTISNFICFFFGLVALSVLLPWNDMNHVFFNLTKIIRKELHARWRFLVRFRNL